RLRAQSPKTVRSPSAASRDALDHPQHVRKMHPMKHMNSHRAPGRAVTPLTGTHRAARALGGSAVLGTVLVGTAFAGGTAAMANDTALAGSDETPSSSQSAPAQSTSVEPASVESVS